MSRYGLLLAVAVATLLAHGRAREGEFLWYDDQRYVVDNPHLESIDPVAFLTEIETVAAPQKATSDIYRPLRTLTFAVLTKAFGKDPRPFHTVAILLHVGCALVLFRLLREAGLSAGPAVAGALAFALHPATVEVTAWVCSLGDAGCGLFVLLSVLAHARGRRVLTMLSLAVALLWKEHAVVAPGLWLAWDLFARPRDERPAPRAMVPPAAIGLALVIGFLVFRDSVGAGMKQLDGPLGGSYTSAVWTMLAGLGFYAQTILFPYSPTFDARVPVHETPFALPVVLGALVAGVLVAGVVRGERRVRLGAAWFLLALVPVSNILVPLKIPTADRFLYIPLMGLAFPAALLVERCARGGLRVAAAGTLVVLGLLTIARTGDWSKDESLLEAGLRVHPKSKMLLWAEASITAQRALRVFEMGDPNGGILVAHQAAQDYERYLRNSVPSERTQVWLELGRMKYEAAQALLRSRWTPDGILAFQRDAFDHYWRAFDLQSRGIGRVVEAEVFEAAERVRELGLVLAQPSERDRIATTLDRTQAALAFLQKVRGRDIRYDQARLILAASVVARASQPEKAKKGLRDALVLLRSLEVDGVEGLEYVRGKVRFYLAIAGGRESVDLELLRRAHEDFAEAARKLPGGARVEPMLASAETLVVLWELGGDEKARSAATLQLQYLEGYVKQQGFQLADRDRLRIDDYRRRLQ